jgi:membrane-bound serine protease (ClpP class)
MDNVMLMVRSFWLVLLFMLFIYGSRGYGEESHEPVSSPRIIVLLEINDAIGPASSDYIERNLDKAIANGAVAVLIRMDTPGGLDISMRRIIKRIIASPIPVITYVAPGGARAASAGTYILYASHIAAMAPATNLGAATPIQIGGFGGFSDDKDDENSQQSKTKPLADPMAHKMVNDAAAYIRGLAKIHGRNQEWAEQAVREAASLSAEEALKLNVIDIIASDIHDLLKQLQGRKIKVAGQEMEFSIEFIEIQQIPPDWRSEFLAVITNPNIAYILLLVGIYGLVFEFSNPGSILPGVIGGISLLLAMYALQLLPINYAGIALILLGVALMVAEAFVPSIGVLGLGGVVSFVIGSIILLDSDIPGFGIDLGLIAGFALSSAAFFIITVGLLIKSRQSPVVCGKEELLGEVGEVLENFTGTGMIRVHSENWRASCDQPVHKNQKVKITAIDGLLLLVKPVEPSEN